MTLLIAPLEALVDPRLTDPERRVLLALYSFRNKNADTVWPSLGALAGRALIKDHTRVSKITGALAKKGWLAKRKRGFTGGNEYRLSIPANLDSDAKLDGEANMDHDANSNLDSDANSNLDSDAKCKEQQIEHQSEHQINLSDSPGNSVDSPPKPKKKTKIQIPDDFVLTADLRDRALEYWLDPKRNRADLDPSEEFEKFHANHRSKGTKMLDWGAAWQTWYSNAVRFNAPPRGNPNAGHQHTNQPRSAVGRVRAATAERERQRSLRESYGSTVGADDRDLRPQMDERLRGDSGSWLGDCIEGDFSREDQAGPGENGR